MTIYLIRHGKTDANEKRLYCGRTDLPLSKSGRKALTERKIPHLPGARFITSGMRRCNETLEILFGNVPCEVVPDFREMDFGAFEMGSYEALKDDPSYQRWIAGDNEANVAPGGESGRQMMERVMNGFCAVLDAGADTVIVTHGGVIAGIMARLFPAENRSRYEWQPAPGGGYGIEWEGDSLKYWVL